MVDLQKPVAFTSGTVRFWWQRGLIGVATISAGIGLIVFFVRIIQTIRQRLKVSDWELCTSYCFG